jgi:nucleoid-associated protein YgaU
MIGIKLADGTFYPILEDGVPAQKILELTTVRNDQTTVQVDLYRSEAGSMIGAEYVDSLLIKNLHPHPKEELALALKIQLDQDNVLSAEVTDPESGNTSHSTVSLVSLSEDKLKDIPDYTLSSSLPDLPDFGGNLSSTDFQFMSGQPLEDIKSDSDFFSLPDDISFPSGFDPDSAEPEETAPAEPTSALEDAVPDIDTADEPLDVLPDFAAPDESDETLVAELPSTEPEPAADEFSMDDFDLPDDTSFPSDFDPDSATPEDDSDTMAEETVRTAPEKEQLAATKTTSQNAPLQTSGGRTSPHFSSSLQDDMGFQGLYDKELYDKETLQGTRNMDSKKTTVPMIICILCALISLLVLGFILFFVPSRIDIQVRRGNQTQTEEAISESLPALAADSVASSEPTIQPEQSIPLPQATEPAPSEPQKTAEPETPAAPAENAIVIASLTESANVIPIVPTPVAEKTKDITYKIKWGDTLWDLADAYYKNPWQYHKIAKANGIKNPDRIISGTYITIPAP